MSIEHALTLNLSAYVPPPVLYMPQGDSASRVIKAVLWNGSEAYTIPSGSVVMVRFGKPDGTGGLYDETEAGNAITYSGNVVTAPVATQMLSAAGKVQADIEIHQAGETAQETVKLATFCFIVNVEKAAYQDAAIISSDYYNIVAAQIAAAIKAGEKAESVNQHPPRVSSQNTWEIWDSDKNAYVDSGKSAKGDPGTSPRVSVTRTEVTGGRGYTQVTFTDVDGDHTATIFDGEEGKKGASGTHGNDVTVTGTAAEATTEHRNGGTKLVFTMTQYNASGAPPTTLELPFTVWNGNDAEVSGITISLPASGWDAEAKTQTVSVTGMTESALVITSAAPVSFVAWSDAGVRCSAQSGGALTFACEAIPTEDLTGNVVILA